ncbi:MAG: ATP-binding protein [Actinomycetota bacterium]|nr:ATP-binding protein [Actinomycetota bacterium]
MTTRPAPRASRGLATRLLAGQSIVLVAGALTAGLVAILVGPAIFHEHLVQAGHSASGAELTHIETAYRDASLISVGVALLISMVAAIAVTWFFTRRLRRPLRDVTDAAQQLSSGNYATRVPDVGSGTELDTLADAFNSMADRLEGVEDTRRRMLSDLAHELRTPIATLSAFHEGLHDGLVILGPESRAVLGEQTDRLARLADDIDEVSTAEEGRLELDLQTGPVSGLLRTAHAEMRDRYALKGVHLAVDAASADGLLVRVDRGRFGQVLTNLLTNALRHTPAGGSVRLTADSEDGEVTLAIADDGEGMTPEQLAHAFERFYRGDSARTRDHSGSGIGLTISQALVDAQGGRLTAASSGAGTGATFTVVLPSAAP